MSCASVARRRAIAKPGDRHGLICQAISPAIRSRATIPFAMGRIAPLCGSAQLSPLSWGASPRRTVPHGRPQHCGACPLVVRSRTIVPFVLGRVPPVVAEIEGLELPAEGIGGDLLHNSLATDQPWELIKQPELLGHEIKDTLSP